MVPTAPSRRGFSRLNTSVRIPMTRSISAKRSGRLLPAATVCRSLRNWELNRPKRRYPSSLYFSGSPKSAMASVSPTMFSASAARTLAISSSNLTAGSTESVVFPLLARPESSPARRASACISRTPRPTAGPPRMRRAAAESVGRISIVATATMSATSGTSRRPLMPTIS